MNDFFSRLLTTWSCRLYIIAKYKTSNFCKIEPVIQWCSLIQDQRQMHSLGTAKQKVKVLQFNGTVIIKCLTGIIRKDH